MDLDATAAAELDLLLRQIASQVEDTTANIAAAACPRSAALLATRAAQKENWTDVRRLALQGYDAFLALWQRVPLL
eukprot:CAMPEP_0172923186 /NCGR_PEP_ID=MMETSP1075-20121228/209264_1 /TAXON_ID=2916 /ORGANISM="Ceratium fusus, Strain PA161109" /LENGTH=75 /DNA_ID=CAMNT_0013783625 /DNA_START=72 /DNA_END=296 /DNA_ORIENTATION=+